MFVATRQILHHSDIYTIWSVFNNILKSSHKIKDNNPSEGSYLLNSKFNTQKGFHINIIEAINNVISKEISTWS